MSDIVNVEEKPVLRLRPALIGFIRRFTLALTPIYIYIIALIIEPTLTSLIGGGTGKIALSSILLFISIGVIAISWVLRSKEAMASTVIAFVIMIIYTVLAGIPQLQGFDIIRFLEEVSNKLYWGYLWGAIIGSAATCLSIEFYRRSITYEITNLGIHISGGHWRKQEQFLPYNQLSRVVMEQSFIGRLFNYGTIIPVGTGEWGQEEYSRGVIVGGGKKGVGTGVIYTRTLKEYSRDPLKSLYGIKNPREVYKLIAKLQSLPLGAELEQVKLLRKLVEEKEKKEAKQ